MSDLKEEMGPAGYRAMVAWQQGAAAALTAGVPQIDQSLRPMRDRLVPQSPLRAGPLKNHERGAAKAAQMYVQGFAGGLNATAIDPQLEQFRKRLAQPVDATATFRTQNARSAAASTSGAGQRQQVQIVVPVQYSVDGKVLGQVVAPHVQQVITGDLQLEMQVIDASRQSSLQQDTFRSIA